MSEPEVGIGIVGYGAMGKAHSYAYAAAPVIRALPCRPRLRVISGRHRDAVARAASEHGADRFTTSWRELVESPDVDIVDVCTSPGTHAEIIEAAAEGASRSCARSRWRRAGRTGCEPPPRCGGPRSRTRSVSTTGACRRCR